VRDEGRGGLPHHLLGVAQVVESDVFDVLPCLKGEFVEIVLVVRLTGGCYHIFEYGAS